MKPVGISINPRTAAPKLDDSLKEKVDGGEQKVKTGKGKPEWAGKGLETARSRLEANLAKHADRGHTPKGLENALEKLKANAARLEKLEGNTPDLAVKTDLGVG